MKRFFKKINSDYRHYICIAITLFFFLFGVLHFKFAIPRIWESIKDIGTSSWYYFCELFEIDFNGVITINEYTKQPFELLLHLPQNMEELRQFNYWLWTLFWDGDNFHEYVLKVSTFFYYASKFLLLILPLLLMIYITLSSTGGVCNDYNKDSSSLIWHKKYIENKIYRPVKQWVISFVSFVKTNSFYYKFCFLMICYSFNFIAIAVEFIAFYIYFVAAYDLPTILIQLRKLLMDLSVIIKFLPGPVWFIIFLIVMDQIRRAIGFNKLNHMERKNRGFINERPIVLMVCGTMGKKKTTMITDMALSQEIMFRDKAFERLLEADLKFPYFPWINLENAVKEAMKAHTVYNLATCEVFVNQKEKLFNLDKCTKNIFDYDYERYGVEYDNKLNIQGIWKIIEDYVKLYFIYIIQSSLLISNYSIRVDNILKDQGNFPLWNNELFKKDSRMVEAYSRHAHILDYDSLRLGRKLIKENPNADSFEFGVVNLTEIGKERGNSLELQAIKKNDDSTNQKNDLFNSWLKMCRHSATVDNFPFIKIITDEQRPESWGADARDLCEIVNIDECGEMRLAMPLFNLEDLFIQWFLKKFQKNYYNYRYDRGDNNLYMYLYHGFASLLNTYHKRIYNTFGYYRMELKVEAGTQDALPDDKTYYLMSKKIYSKRFSTDCFSDYFKEKSLRSKVGINDLPEFVTEKASFDEMGMENSYFFNDLTKLRNKGKEE